MKKDFFGNKFLLILLTSVCLVPAIAYAQEVFHLDDDHVCSYSGVPNPSAVYAFASSTEANHIISNIMSHVGLKKNFVVRASGVSNAAATIRGENRYILYNERFISWLNNQTNSTWASTSVLAHEIGHHLNGHTLDGLGSRPKIELEADEFSGFVLGKMGASLSEAQLAMRKIGNESASKTHPAKADRLRAIQKGWERATGHTGSMTKTVSMRTISFHLNNHYAKVTCHDVQNPSVEYDFVVASFYTDIDIPKAKNVKCSIYFPKRGFSRSVTVKDNESQISCSSDFWKASCSSGNPMHIIIRLPAN